MRDADLTPNAIQSHVSIRRLPVNGGDVTLGGGKPKRAHLRQIQLFVPPGSFWRGKGLRKRAWLVGRELPAAESD